MKTLLFVFMFFMVYSCGGAGGSGNSNGSGGSTDNNENFVGQVVYNLLNIISNEANADQPEICSSTCTMADQTQCVKLIIVNTDATETVVCKTNLINGRDYQFKLLSANDLINEIITN